MLVKNRSIDGLTNTLVGTEDSGLYMWFCTVVGKS